MTADLTWHIPEPTLQAYLAGRALDADAWSVEAHLTSCQTCRRALAAVNAADQERASALDHSWTALAATLPTQGRVRPGGRWREVRVLITGGPAARWAWLAACVLVLIFAAVAGASGASHVPWLGIVAPVVPLLGVAASYGSGLDDAYEVIATTPGGGLRLLLVRTAAVLSVTTPVALAGGALTGHAPGPWLLASLTLTLLTLALGSAIGVERAAVGIGAGWVILASTVIADPFQRVPVVLSPAAMPVLLAVALAASAVVIARRSAFNHLPLHHRTRIEASL